jgi:hypothetical protein
VFGSAFGVEGINDTMLDAVLQHVNSRLLVAPESGSEILAMISAARQQLIKGCSQQS